jgi:hypothetical protein
MTEGALFDVFGIDGHIMRDPRNGSPMCIAYAAA